MPERCRASRHSHHISTATAIVHGPRTITQQAGCLGVYTIAAACGQMCAQLLPRRRGLGLQHWQGVGSGVASPCILSTDVCSRPWLFVFLKERAGFFFRCTTQGGPAVGWRTCVCSRVLSVRDSGSSQARGGMFVTGGGGPWASPQEPGRDSAARLCALHRLGARLHPGGRFNRHMYIYV